MRYVEIDGGRLATESFGTPGDPPLVLVMGATASMLGWPDELCTALARQRLHVIRFDHRDTGRSTTRPPGPPGYDVETMAGDVLAIMDAFDLGRASLMGMSLGGYIAQMIALDHPARVRSLILLGTEPLGWDGPPLPHMSQDFLERFSALASLDWADRSAVADVLLDIDRACAGTGQPFDEAAARERIARVCGRTESPASMFNHAALAARGDWAGRFRDISCPVLVIHGDEDPVLPVANGRAIAEGIEGAELVVLEGVGHEIPRLRIPEIAERAGRHASR